MCCCKDHCQRTCTPKPSVASTLRVQPRKAAMPLGTTTRRSEERSRSSRAPSCGGVSGSGGSRVLHRLIDAGHQIGRQGPGFGGRDTLGELLAVLHAENQRVDRERQRVAVRQDRGVDAEFGAELPKPAARA